MPRRTKLRSTLLFGVCALGLTSARVGLASELDPQTGQLRSTQPNAVMIGFEDAAQLARLGVTLTKWQSSGSGYSGSSTLVFVDSEGPAMTASELSDHLAADPAVEGKQALLLSAASSDKATGLLFPFSLSTLASEVGSQRVQVTAWVRCYGATPLLVATYSSSSTRPAPSEFTTVTAIRTGRETSDGWAEISTGPIDTSIWGVPLSQISFGLSSSDTRRNATASLVIDALEIAPAEGAAVPPTPCTIATQDTNCGPDGECQFGHCLPAYASWGPTPPADHRADLVDRWIALAKHTQGARNAVANADAMVSMRPRLTAATIGGREFYAGMSQLVNALRNHHTSFGAPANSGLLQPLAAGASSSTLGACAGVGDLDLLAAPGQHLLGFIIYKVAAKSVVGADLKIGDAITKIDGMDPLTWVRSVYLTWSPGVPSDPGADLAWSARLVAWMISHRATTLEITRCAPDTNCAGSNRKVIAIDVAGPAWKNLQGTGQLGNEDDSSILSCAERFQNALSNPPGQSSTYGNLVGIETIWGDVLAVQFDGTLADFAQWQGQVVPSFSKSPAPTKVLFDVRQGNGGYAQNSELIAEEIRPKTDPMGVIGLPSACWDRSDAWSDLLAVLQATSPSCEFSTTAAPCDLVTDYYFIGDWYQQVSAIEPVTSFTPGGLEAKVAWLHAANVSANDYLAALVEGRANQRIFGPGPTSGAYGTITSLPSHLLGWSGGSIQMSDAVWGPSPAAMASKPFRSGVGVPVDEIAAQKMSDAMKNVDTMLAAAKAWLQTP